MQQIVCIAVTRLAYLLPKLCTVQEKIPLETLENAASSPPDGFARNLLADFPSYCPEIPCQTYSLPAEFLCNLPKNLTTHLTHKLFSVFP